MPSWAIPGYFALSRKGRAIQNEIKRDFNDFNRMEGIAWEEVAVYRSARAPNGCVMYETGDTTQVNKFKYAQAAHAGSQDTVLMWGGIGVKTAQ